MDDIDRKIIGLLSEDARRGLGDVGAVVGLSASAVNERMRRLRAEGAIRRYSVDVDPEKLGKPVLAFVFVALGEEASEPEFLRFAATQPAIVECHHVTGAWSYLLKVRVGGLDEVEAFLSALKTHGMLGRSETMIALSSPVAGAFVPGAE